MSSYAAALHWAGMSAGAAENKGETFEQLRRSAKQLQFREPLHAFYVPGRIEVLGKHTDYAGGRSLLCSVERGFCVMASRRDDRAVRFVDLNSNSTAEWEFTLTPSTPAAPWAIYPLTVTRRLARNFPSAQNGIDVLFSSDLPPAAGMSSSSAFVIASFFAIAAANELQSTEPFRQNLRTQEELASYLACVENGSSFRSLSGDSGVGTFGGSEDHTAILCCTAGEIAQYAFCPLHFERSSKLPKDLIFVLGASGVAAEKTGNARERYNQLSFATNSIMEIWNRTTGRRDPSLGCAVRSSPISAEQIRKMLSDLPAANVPADTLQNRFQQFFAETEIIVPQSYEALARHDWERFGKLVDLSQSNAELLLDNQIPETLFLARSARELGAIAASAFGAGFGGSVWSLVQATNIRQFIEAWSCHYREQFPQHPSATFFSTFAGPAARSL